MFLNAKPGDKELLIVDGGSTDETCEIINGWTSKHNNIKLVENPDKYVPFALNKAIKMSSGDPIVRLDAHTEFAEDYFEKIIETFNITGADVVGGPMRAVGKSDFQKAVALATGTVFGIGDSKIHRENYSGESDHVYLGAWQRKYGLFKPLVFKKTKSEIKVRHIIPAVFCVYLLGLPLTYFSIFYLLPLFLYTVLNLYFSLRFSRNIIINILLLIIYPSIHISYGLGFIAGILKN
ncbi:MAG: glycosyltransferase [Ignavibacteriaceae bacterium]